MNAKSLVAAILGAAAVLATGFARAADIKVLASNGVKAALEELAPAFERETGNKLVISFGLAAALKRQIESGEAFDVAILTSAGIEDLAKQGKVDGASRVSLARSGWASASGKADRVPTSARPTPSSARCFRRNRSPGEGRAKRHLFRGLLERIGIAEQMKPKVVPAATGTEVGKLVASGRSSSASSW